MLSFKNGALIAIAAGSLFAAACKKDEKKAESMDKPAMGEKAGDMKAGDTKAGDMKAGDTMAKPAMAGEKMAKIHCGGVNECKGHGACKGEANACAGQNGCAGKGFVEMSEEDCKAKHGTVMAAAK